MNVIRTVDEMKNLVRSWREDNLSVGLVPTMGYLHDGHMSLVRASRENNNKTIVTIFVNPKQFGENEDLDVYPRDEKGDLVKCHEYGVDAVFAPSVSEMYPDCFGSLVDVTGVSDGLSGSHRPGHFQGVCTVVMKLFNITTPDNAYFGQKDAQQLAVIKKMVTDLNMNLKVVGCPTIRESDGLAMSSRNSYLSTEERAKAPALFKALSAGMDAFSSGEKRSEKIKSVVSGSLMDSLGLDISSQNGADGIIDYIEIADPVMMKPQDIVREGDLCLISVQIGKTTLIDNICIIS